MKRTLRTNEIKDLLDKISAYGDTGIGKKDRWEAISNIYLINGKASFFEADGRIFPTLKTLMDMPMLKKITVDMGAIPFIVKGADIMRPGITDIEPGIAKNEAVLVVDEKHGKALAVGLALYPSSEMQMMKTGKAVKNLHWVGDSIWTS